MNGLIEIDGTRFQVGQVKIERNFEVLDGEGTERVQSGRLHREIIGTYYNYTLSFGNNTIDPSDYDKLYEILSSPDESHMITVPYGRSGTITYEAYCSKGKDTLFFSRDGNHRWKGLSINFIATEPART